MGLTQLVINRAARPKRTSAASFKGEVLEWAEKIGVKPTGLYIQRMTKKWSSCSMRGRVCFSTDLLAEDRAFQTVVIVHEILHLTVPNHGKLFKSLMNAYVPDWDRIAGGRVRGIGGFTGTNI